MTKQSNKKRRIPDFGVNDSVFVVKKSWSTDRPSDKLDFSLTRCHYKIKKMSGYSYRLEVPERWRATDVFCADRLRKYPNNPLPGQASENPDAEEIDSHEEWEVERIVTSRLRYGKLLYQV